jgi:hypothetical protein
MSEASRKRAQESAPTCKERETEERRRREQIADDLGYLLARHWLNQRHGTTTGHADPQHRTQQR